MQRGLRLLGEEDQSAQPWSSPRRLRGWQGMMGSRMAWAGQSGNEEKVGSTVVRKCRPCGRLQWRWRGSQPHRLPHRLCSSCSGPSGGISWATPQFCACALAAPGRRKPYFPPWHPWREAGSSPSGKCCGTGKEFGCWKG